MTRYDNAGDILSARAEQEASTQFIAARISADGALRFVSADDRVRGFHVPPRCRKPVEVRLAVLADSTVPCASEEDFPLAVRVREHVPTWTEDMKEHVFLTSPWTEWRVRRNADGTFGPLMEDATDGVMNAIRHGCEVGGRVASGDLRLASDFLADSSLKAATCDTHEDLGYGRSRFGCGAAMAAEGLAENVAGCVVVAGRIWSKADTEPAWVVGTGVWCAPPYAEVRTITVERETDAEANHFVRLDQMHALAALLTRLGGGRAPMPGPDSYRAEVEVLIPAALRRDPLRERTEDSLSSGIDAVLRAFGNEYRFGLMGDGDKQAFLLSVLARIAKGAGFDLSAHAALELASSAADAVVEAIVSTRNAA